MTLGVLLIGFNWGDEPQPDDSDLLTEPPALQESDDGYPLLIQAVAAHNGVSDLGRLKDLPADGSDDEWLRLELEIHEEALALLTQAIERPAIALPRIPVFEVREELGDVRDMARLMTMRGRANLHTSTGNDGLNDLLQVVRLGRQLAEGGGAMIELLSALAVQGFTLQALREEAPRLHLTADETRTFLRELNREKLSREIFAATLRAEYVLTKEMQDALLSEVEDKTGWYPALGYMMKPNKTLRLMAEEYREFISLVKEPVYSRDDWPDDQVSIESSLPLENAAGRSLVEISVPTMTRVMLSAFLMEAFFGATELVVALTAFEKSEGRLPETLGELEGTWIDSLPVDPFSGEPLRYSKADRLVFTVGPEQIEAPAAVPTAEEDKRGFILPEMSDAAVNP